MDKLKEIGKLLNTQDNRATDAPLFIVQQKIIDYGYTSDYAEDYEWMDANNEYSKADSKKAKQLETLDDAGEDTGTWEKIYYKERWEFVTACFTEQGCTDYIAINGHNLNEPRIYAEGSYRNNEFRTIRDWLKKLYV